MEESEAILVLERLTRSLRQVTENLTATQLRCNQILLDARAATLVGKTFLARLYFPGQMTVAQMAMLEVDWNEAVAEAKKKLEAG